MTVTSLKDYAKQHNITYEAVRQQVARYREELGEHIIIDGRQQLLDEAAVAFLDARREKNPVVVMQQDKDDRIDELDKENKLLLKKIASLQEDLIHEKDERAAIAEKIANINLLEARAKEAEAVTEALKEQADEANQKAADFEKLAIDARKREVEATTETEKAKAETAEIKAKYENLKKRNLWQRIWNK